MRRGLRHAVLTCAAAALMGAAIVAPAAPGAAVPGTAKLSAAMPSTGAALASAGQPGTPAGRATTTLTLVTGDRIQLDRLPGGRQAATIDPGPGREHVDFQQFEIDGELYVFPLDVLPYVAAKRVDQALFNVTKLVADGYDDAHRTTIPLILTYTRDANASASKAMSVLRAATAGPVLQSVNGRAVAADKRQAERFWESVDDDRVSSRSGAQRVPTLAGDIARIQLDAKVTADLDRSVPQIGAPAAWEAGFDGTGVTVAVLDTGVDTTHPDLAGVITETRNFTPSPTTEDKVGHGTHVAATIAGTGAAAGGTRKGVAPGARILAGKVLNDSGSGLVSWILDGMEWAAGSGADVVNMSLGGGPTDGTDILSQGLDALTDQTGTLFVVSAGNDGENGEFTVGSPGAANRALTVGAVDRNDALAEFSSRGPRTGDFAIKPDITAPGVGIVAARAAGTTFGTPVDASYTALSGTSMAAPHVAGAAAILAQQHPGWGARELKDALASTAERKDGLTVFEQGGGRVDVARAVGQGVHATGTLDLGVYEDAAAPAEVRKEVTFTNASDHAVTLALALSLRDQQGNAPADGSVRLGASEVELAAGATATVPVIVDPARLGRGRVSGWLTGTADGVVVHTSLGLMKELPRHKVTVRALDREGAPTFAVILVMFGLDRRFDTVTSLGEAGRSIEVAEGTYYLNSLIAGGRAPHKTMTMAVDPVLEVTHDLTVTLDARKATEVVIKTPEPAVQDGYLSYYAYRELGGRRLATAGGTFDGTRLYVTPTRQVTDGAFEFSSRWQLIAPPLTAKVVGAGLALEPWYMNSSPALDGTRTLPLAYLGAGLPDDYRGRDVRGKIVLIDAETGVANARVRTAADAGAAMVLAAQPAGAPTWTAWTPVGDRLPAMGALLTHEDGERLVELLQSGSVKLRLDGTPASPYLYDVMQVSKGRVPDKVVHRVDEQNSATVASRYRESGGIGWAKDQRFGWRPWQETSINHRQRFHRTPAVRQEIVSSGDTYWQHRVKYHFSRESDNELAGGLVQTVRRYTPGQRVSEDWFAPVGRPAIPVGLPGITSYRSGDGLTIRVPQWADSVPGHYGFGEGGLGEISDVTRARFYRDGQLVTEAPEAWATFPAVAKRATYRLDLTVVRDTPEWNFARRTDTSWTFRSARPDVGEQPLLPILSVDYEVATDLRNRAVADAETAVDLTVRQQEGFGGDGPAATALKAWASFDDGGTWTKLDVANRGDGRFRARVAHPRLDRTSGYVTLRVQARDAAGSVVDQTVERAYGLKK